MVAGEGFLSQWTMSLFKSEYCALELDMLHGKNFAERILINREHIKEASEENTTSQTHTQIDQKILKSACQNILVVVVTVLQEYQYKRTLAIMVYSCSPLKHWQGKAAKDMKSSKMNIDWLKDQFDKGFSDLLVEILETLGDTKVLRVAGFFEFQGMNGEEQQSQSVLDDDFAKLHGSLVMHLLAARLRRLLYVRRGWPHMFIYLLLSPRQAQMCLQLFKKDYEAYKAVAEHADFQQCRKVPAVKAAIDRSLFQLTSVVMFLAACKETSFCTHPDLEKITAECVGGCLSTLGVEDTNNVQKNNKQCKGSMKFRRPERAFAVSVASGVLDARHKYEPVRPTNQVESSGLVLPSSAFGKPTQKKGPTTKPTVDLTGIATFQVKAPYFSPVAAGVSTPTADLAVFSELKDFPALRHVAGQVFMGCFAEPGLTFVFRRVSKVGTPFGWHLGMGSFNKSGFIAWPISMKEVPGHHKFFYISAASKMEVPHVHAVFDWDGMEAVMFTWRSWAWQCINCPRALKNEAWQPATRMITDGKHAPLIQVAAKMAFWNLDMSMIKEVCKIVKKIEFPAAGVLLDVLTHAIRQILGVTEFDALTIVQQRMIKDKRKDDEGTKALLEVDEAVKCLEPQDEKLLLEELPKVQIRLDAQLDFENQWRSRREQTSPHACANPKAKANASRGGSSSSTGVQSRLPAVMSMMDQKEAKTWMPPHKEARLWKSRTSGCWNSVVPPYGACSRSVSKYGENEALKIVLSSAWHDYCLVEGIPPKSCPMGGLLEVV